MSASATFLYVGNGETRDVSAFALDDQNGDLAPIDTFAVPGPTNSCFSFPLAVSPDKRVLLLSCATSPGRSAASQSMRQAVASIIWALARSPITPATFLPTGPGGFY